MSHLAVEWIAVFGKPAQVMVADRLCELRTDTALRELKPAVIRKGVNYQPKVTPQLSSESHPLRG